jgi:hypothetical protein
MFRFLGRFCFDFVPPSPRNSPTYTHISPLQFSSVSLSLCRQAARIFVAEVRPPWRHRISSILVRSDLAGAAVLVEQQPEKHRTSGRAHRSSHFEPRVTITRGGETQRYWCTQTRCDRRCTPWTPSLPRKDHRSAGKPHDRADHHRLPSTVDRVLPLVRHTHLSPSYRQSNPFCAIRSESKCLC